MGGTQSVEQRTQKATEEIEGLHDQIVELQNQILREGDELIQDITKVEYTDADSLCNIIDYHYVDRLVSHFPIKAIEGVSDRLQLGVVPKPETQAMIDYKKEVCMNIAQFYKKKILLINQIKQELPKCVEMESEIHRDLATKLQEQGINTSEWLNVYKKVQDFNKDIKTRYGQIDRLVADVKRAQTWPALNTVGKNLANLLGSTNTMCRRYQSDLSRFEANLTRESPEGMPTQPRQRVDEPESVQVEEPEESQAEVPLVKGSVIKMTRDYRSNQPGTLNLRVGDEIEILEDEQNGWLLVRTSQGKEGFVSKYYLE